MMNARGLREHGEFGDDLKRCEQPGFDGGDQSGLGPLKLAKPSRVQTPVFLNGDPTPGALRLG